MHHTFSFQRGQLNFPRSNSCRSSQFDHKIWNLVYNSNGFNFYDSVPLLVKMGACMADCTFQGSHCIFLRWLQPYLSLHLLFCSTPSWVGVYFPFSQGHYKKTTRIRKIFLNANYFMFISSFLFLFLCMTYALGYFHKKLNKHVRLACCFG